MSYDLKNIIKAIKKEFLHTEVASDIPDLCDYISTGNWVIDLMLGGYGIPFGFVTEWAGLSASGKTLMLQQQLAIAQRDYDAIGIWADRENAFFNERAREMGINIDNVILGKPQDFPTVSEAEAWLLKAIATVRAKFPDVYIYVAVDSISSFYSKQKGEDMGRKAKHLHSLYKKVLPFVDSKVSFNYANQITFKPDVMFGNAQTTTGGEAPKYYSHFRLFLDNKRDIISDQGEVVGNHIHFRVKKTRTSPNFREAIIPFYFDSRGIPEWGGYVRMLVNLGYVKPKNKVEFKKFAQKTVLYNDRQYYEEEVERILSQNHELIFDEWPGFNKEEVEEIEEDDKE